MEGDNYATFDLTFPKQFAALTLFSLISLSDSLSESDQSTSFDLKTAPTASYINLPLGESVLTKPLSTTFLADHQVP